MVYFDAEMRAVQSMNAGWNSCLEEDDPLTIPFMGTHSGRSVLVGGFFAGIQAAHDRYGKLPFSSLFEPSIYWAENGILVNKSLAGIMQSREAVITSLPEIRKVFMKANGEIYQEGDVFKQSELAETLRNVATQGTDYIYRGEWAQKFVDIVQREGGKVTMQDLQNYEVIWSEPSHTAYRDYDVYSLGIPSYGGVNTLEALNLYEEADLPRFGHYTESADALYWFIQISQVAGFTGPSDLSLHDPNEIMRKHMPDMKFSDEYRLSEESAERIWRLMQSPQWKMMKQEAYEEAMKDTGAIEGIIKSFQRPKKKHDEFKKKTGHSAAVVAVDEKGNIAAVVHTINSGLWGSGIMVDGISVADAASFQQKLIKKHGPSARLPDPTHPHIILKNGTPYLGGSSIGFGLHEGTLQCLTNVLDFGMNPRAAVEKPQFGTPEWIPVESNMQTIGEGEFSEEILEGVIALGQLLKVNPKPGYWIGITIDPKTGELRGGVSSKLNGLADGY